MDALLRAIVEVEQASGSAVATSSSSASLESRCLQLFNEWVGKAKLAVGYLLYVNHGHTHSAAFITRVVQHLSSKLDRLRPDDVVALMLMIYLRRAWDAEEIDDFLDAAELQRVVAQFMVAGHFGSGEICAICLGLKRISGGFLANAPAFRAALYAQLEAMANLAATAESFGFIDNMAVVNIIVLLTRGSHITLDDASMLVRVKSSFAAPAVVAALNIRTAVKVMSLGIHRGVHDEALSSAVCARLSGGLLCELTLRELVGLVSFLSRVPQPDADVIESVKAEVAAISDHDCGLQDVADFLRCFLFLSYLGHYDRAFLDAMVKAINGLPEELFAADVPHCVVAREIARALHRAIFPASYSHADFEATWAQDFAAVAKDVEFFTRTPAFIDRTAAIDRLGGGTDDTLNLSSWEKIASARCQRLLRLTQRPLPLEARSRSLPLNQKSSRHLSPRQRLLIGTQRELADVLGSEGYVYIGYILPHFQEPDLMFGHMAGNKLHVPSYIAEASPTAVKVAPDVGDWFVVSVNSKTKTEQNRTGLNGTERLKSRLLEKLGYKVISVDYTTQPLDRRKRVDGEFAKPSPLVEYLLQQTIFDS